MVPQDPNNSKCILWLCRTHWCQNREAIKNRSLQKFYHWL
jgi:hypothetical protein